MTIDSFPDKTKAEVVEIKPGNLTVPEHKDDYLPPAAPFVTEPDFYGDNLKALLG